MVPKAAGMWDVVGFAAVGLPEVGSAWGAQAVPASSPRCAGMELPALPWTPRENETCTSGMGAHARSTASLFIPANSPQLGAAGKFAVMEMASFRGVWCFV